MNSNPTRTVASTVSQNLDPRMISDYYLPIFNAARCYSSLIILSLPLFRLPSSNKKTNNIILLIIINTSKKTHDDDDEIVDDDNII